MNASSRKEQILHMIHKTGSVTTAEVDGYAWNRVDPERVEEFMAVARKVRRY